MESNNPRTVRVAQDLKHHISEIVLKDVQDPRVKLVTITDVEMSPDLRHAKVFFSTIGDEKTRQQCYKGLVRASGFIKRELGKRIRLRYMPDITFHQDYSLEYGDKIERLLKTIHQDQPPSSMPDMDPTQKD